MVKLELCSELAGTEKEIRLIGIHTKNSVVIGHEILHDLRKILGELPQLRISRRWDLPVSHIKLYVLKN